MVVMNSFFRFFPSVEEAVEIAEMVVMQITDMGTPNVGHYNHTVRFLGYPHCFLNNFSVVHLCQKCFAFKYATRFQELC